MYKVTNPATGVVEAEFETMTNAQVDDAIERAHLVQRSWSRSPVGRRAATLRRAAELFEERSSQLAQLVTREMGKRPVEGEGELALTAKIFRYYADNAEALVDDEEIVVGHGRAIIERRPVGVIVGVMPWNYPYYQVARFAAPNLLLGNTIILKPAPSCPTSSAAIERLLHNAGVPADAYINAYASNEQVADMLADPRIQGISLTGSERAGIAVAAEAGRNLKKVVLELGGSDPMIVLDTSDVDRLASLALAARMSNAGQACNAPKRMIVMADIYDRFVATLTRKASELVPGDPVSLTTTLAPLSSREAADRLLDQIERAVQQGAVLRTGGRRLDGPGALVEATVMTDVEPGMDAYTEELFGPVAVVYRVEDEEEAIRLANDSPYGLGAAVFSTDPDRARQVGRRLDVGMVFINALEGSRADLPFGGVKRSGFGRELGALGIEEFMNKRIVRL